MNKAFYFSVLLHGLYQGLLTNWSNAMTVLQFLFFFFFQN